jgi:hypothetical protein
MVGYRRLSLGKKFYSQITPLLKDICCIDGATVFSYNGELLGFGCMVKSSSDSRSKEPEPEGARSTAAIQASQNGIAIKVSSDGDAWLYIKGKKWGAVF